MFVSILMILAMRLSILAGLDSDTPPPSPPSPPPPISPLHPPCDPVHPSRLIDLIDVIDLIHGIDRTMSWVVGWITTGRWRGWSSTDPDGFFCFQYY